MKRETSYEIWMREEGIPIIEGYGIEDVTELLFNIGSALSLILP